MVAYVHGSAHGSFLKAYRIIQHQEGIRGKVFQEGDDLAEEHLVLIHAGEIALLLKCFQVAGCPGQQLIRLFHQLQPVQTLTLALRRLPDGFLDPIQVLQIIKGFPGRFDHHFLHVFQRPLSGEIKTAQGINFVAEKFNAHGLG